MPNTSSLRPDEAAKEMSVSDPTVEHFQSPAMGRPVCATCNCRWPCKDSIDARIRAAVAAERERCAELCDIRAMQYRERDRPNNVTGVWVSIPANVARELAAAIRAKGGEGTASGDS